MAQENIKETKPLFKYSIGARYIVFGEVKFPAKYKTEGCEFTVKQLEELGLPEGIIDWGWVLNSAKAAKGVEAVPMQFNISKPGFEEGVQKVKIQAYECIKEAELKELAAESTVTSEITVLVLVAGK